MTMQQFDPVDCRYGAPLGRMSSHADNGRPWQLFAVRLDEDGYDDGGAYWGVRRRGEHLFCVEQTGHDGGRHFTDAATYQEAALKLADRVPVERIMQRM